MADEPFQLELTATLTDIPQANSLPLFVRLMEEVQRGTVEVPALSESLGVDERTVQYYLEFGRWLGFLRLENGRHSFTEQGSGFAHSVPARGRLFAQAMFRQRLVQTISALKRDSVDADGVETLTTLEAAERAIEALSDLAQSTVERRASGIAHMLEAAYRVGRIDWRTGEEAQPYRNLVFEFPGRTFLTAMAARQFALGREIRVGFPRQVPAFVRDHGHRLSTTLWQRASYESSDGTATWFGSVPVNETTIDVAERRGRDLRKLLVICVPYVALSVALLTWRDAQRRPAVRLTQDMYGTRVWVNDRDLGGLLDVVESLAESLGLVIVRGVPRALRQAPDLLVESGDADDLIEVLVASGILKVGDTAFELMAGLEDELRESQNDSTSAAERLKALQVGMADFLRQQPT